MITLFHFSNPDRTRAITAIQLPKGFLKGQTRLDLTIGLGIFVLVLSVLCGLHLWRFHSYSEHFNSIIAHQDLFSLCARTSMELEKQSRSLLAADWSDPDKTGAQFKSSQERVATLLENIQNLSDHYPHCAVSETIKLHLAKLNQISEQLNGSGREIIQLIQKDELQEAEVRINAFVRPILENEIQKHAFTLIDEGKADVETVRTTWKKEERKIATIFNALAVTLFAVLFFVSTTIARKILRREHAMLKRSEEKYRAVFNNSHDGILIVDGCNRILDANIKAAELMGYEKESLTGAVLSEIVLPANGNGTSELTAQNLKSKGMVDARKIKRRDGLVVWVEIHAASFFLDGEERLVVQVRDVTSRKKASVEKKRLEVQLYHAQKMEAIGTLAGGIAHDFNNLLTGILGNVSLMMLDLSPCHGHYKKLEGIEKLVKSGARLISHLLGYARKGKYEVNPIDINHLIAEATETFQRTKKQITIQEELAENVPAVMADRGQIEQVLFNLYVNAADAMPNGGTIAIQTAVTTHEQMRADPYTPRSGRYLMIRVSDTGVGMSTEVRKRIFEPFFTTKDVGKGTGLGLASAFGIVKSHGGYIDVDSEPDKGSIFTIYLPAIERQIAETKEEKQELLNGYETVLLIDDEEAIRSIGRELLSAIGYTVMVCKSGEEAIQLYKKHMESIDMVILDMIMPDIGGGETFDRLKALNSKVRILLSSGYSLDGQAQEILNRGCDGFIQKPFSLLQLSQKVREVLHEKKHLNYSTAV